MYGYWLSIYAFCDSYHINQFYCIFSINALFPIVVMTFVITNPHPKPFISFFLCFISLSYVSLIKKRDKKFLQYVQILYFQFFNVNARLPLSCDLLRTLWLTNRYWSWKFSIILRLGRRWCESICAFAICWALIWIP